MSKKILVAYGTAAGSTGEVAEAIAEEISKTTAQSPSKCACGILPRLSNHE